jgi:hypothetical protein
MATENDPKKTNGGAETDANENQDVIDSPEEVQESNDEKIDQDFPGYPHYPAKDDILDPDNHTARVDIDVENLTRSHTITADHLKSIEGAPEVTTDFTQVPEAEGEDIEMVPGTEADVTAEDLLILGPKDGDMDMDEDEELRSRGWEPRSGKDLDVPEASTANGEEALGQEDEENSYYSLGGDERENLRESDDQNNF